MLFEVKNENNKCVKNNILKLKEISIYLSERGGGDKRTIHIYK